MIFLTVGTTKFPFDRLLKAIDEVMIKLNSGEELIVQKGTGDYKFEYPRAKIFKEIPFNKMISYMKKARVIITHGGPATIFLALKYGQNRPLVIPRSKKFGEHVDDHELLFAGFLKNQGGIQAIFPEDDLTAKIKQYLSRPVKAVMGRKTVGSKGIVKKLTTYTKLLK